MGLLGDFFGRLRSGWVTKAPGDDYWYTPRASETVSGVKVDELTSLTFATVFSCVHKLAKTEATLPYHVYRRAGREREIIADHWLSRVWGRNIPLRKAVRANLELWGNAYVLETWNNARTQVLTMEVLPSRWITVKLDTATGELIYEYKPEGRTPPEVYSSDRVLHLKAFTLDGVTGLSTIGCARQAVGLGIAATTFGEAFFGNGAWFGGLVTKAPNSTKQFSEEAARNMLESLNKFKSPKNAFGFGLLRGEMDFKQLEMPFEDAMFLQTRQFQREEICGIFDVPPSMIQDLTRGTFANTEQQDLSFAKHSILPRCVDQEQAIGQRYLADNEYCKHNLAGLMRGDFGTRMTGYATGRQWGFFSINDVREMEDLNPIDGGNTYLEPLNMQPVGSPRLLPQPTQENQDGEQ